MIMNALKCRTLASSTNIYTAVSIPSKSISTNCSYYGTIITNKFEILPLKSARVSIHEVWVETHSQTDYYNPPPTRSG